MYLELRRSGPIAATCSSCGATELMYQGSLPLCVDLLNLIKDYPSWRPFARRRERILRERILSAWEPIVDRTRFPLSSGNDVEMAVDRS